MVKINIVNSQFAAVNCKAYQQKHLCHSATDNPDQRLQRELACIAPE